MYRANKHCADTNTVFATDEIICDILHHATRLPPLICNETSRILFKERLGTLLALTGSCGRWCAITLANPILWTDVFVDAMSPDLLCLH